MDKEKYDIMNKGINEKDIIEEIIKFELPIIKLVEGLLNETTLLNVYTELEEEEKINLIRIYDDEYFFYNFFLCLTIKPIYNYNIQKYNNAKILEQIYFFVPNNEV